MFVSDMFCYSDCLNFDVQLIPPRRHDKVIEFLREAGEITEVKVVLVAFLHSKLTVHSFFSFLANSCIA